MTRFEGHRPEDRKQWASIVLWPDSVSTGETPNESRDYHYTEGAATAVCRGVEIGGLKVYIHRYQKAAAMRTESSGGKLE
jgi:hypothetical protein